MTTAAYRSLWRALAILSCAALAACQAAYGDYKTGEVPPGVGGQANVSGGAGNAGANPGGTSSAGGANGGNGKGGTTSTSTATCSPENSHRCEDTSIDTCTNGNWVSNVSCSRDLCNSTTGACMLCVPGANRCSAFNLQTCSTTGTEWTTTAQCDTSDYCDAVTNTCLTCLPGEAFCDGASLYTCNSQQNGWAVKDCSSPDLCDSRSQDCQVCPSTDWVSCNGASLVGCDGSGHHVQLDICQSSQLCTQTIQDKLSNPSGWTGKCEAGCTPGAYQCNPNNPAELMACPPSGLQWEHVDTCLTPQLCDAANKMCDPGCGAAPGTYRCEGADLELCRSDGTGWDTLKTCQDAAHCNTQQHDCIACVPGNFQCSGATLQSCSATYTWGTVKACASATLCDATDGTCTTPGCTRAGAYQCVGTSLQQCAADLTGWVTKDTCVTSTLCDATNGRCTPPVCTTPGAYRCQGSTRQICDDATRNWKDVNTCATGQVCDLTDPSGCLGTCPTVPARCNAADAQKCVVVNNLPQWQTVTTCATSALCTVSNNTASCTTPTCAVNQYRCSGSALQKCNAGRNGWDTVKTCTSGQICDATLAQCDVCTPNTYTCNSILQLLKCSSDGLSNAVVDNCPSVAYCYTSTDKLTGYCYRCAAGDTQCVGTSQIQSCATDRRGWNTATSCQNGCQVSSSSAGHADYCAACPTAGQVQCVTTAAPGSTHTCATDRSAWGATTTCTAGYGCVSTGTADYCASACSPNTASCVTNTSRHVCNADGKGFGATISQCADASHLMACANGSFSGTSACPSATPYCVNGACVACTGTTTTCATSSTLNTCNNGSWVSSTCPSATPICSGGACVACTSASASTCSDSATVRYCASNNTWATSACSGATPYCANGACVACLSSYLPTCATNTSVQSCSSGSYLQTACAGTTPVCYAASSTTAAVCAPCNSTTQPTCLSDGLTLQTCINGSYANKLCKDVNASTAYCLNGACAGCNASTPATCATNSSLSTCDTTTGTVVTNPCPAATPVCTGAPGKCVQCAPDSAFVCTKSNASNTWYDGRYSCTNSTINSQTCATGQVCDPADDTCKTATCSSGQNVCASDTVLNTCNGTRTGWISTTCTGACYQGACVTCKPGSTKCSGDTGLLTCLPDGSGWSAATSQCADNWSLKTCVNGTLSSTATTTCPSTAPVCSNGQCIPATCDVGQVVCSADLSGSQVCNSTRTGWNTTACTGNTPVCQQSTGTCGCSSNSDCASQGMVCSNSRCETAVCAPNTYQCLGNKLQRCNATQTGWDDVTTCSGTTPVCQATTGSCGCSSSADCSGATPVCSGNQCVPCTPGTYLCAGNVSQACTAQGWQAVTTCAGTTPVCLASGQCGCSSSSQCASASALTPVCSTTNNTCVQCSTAADCVSVTGKPVCDATNNTCVGCLTAADCASLPGTPVCNTTSKACVACLTSAQCSGTTPICSADSCVACSATLPCPTGTCQSDGSCLASASP